MQSYRSLIAWQLARAVSLATFETFSNRNNPEAWALFNQIRRAAVSPEANIVEGYALGTPAQFRCHLRIALGSAVELESLLEISVAAKFMTGEEVASLLGELRRLQAVLTGLLRARAK